MRSRLFARSAFTLSLLAAALSLLSASQPISSSAVIASHADPDVFANVATLEASESASTEYFGAAVATSKDTVVVGAPGRNVAHVFTRPDAGWDGLTTEDAILTPSQLGQDEQFGWSVAISNATIVVSANSPRDQSVYVFVKPERGWSGVVTESARLAMSDGSKLFVLGRWLAISDETVVMAGALSDTIRERPSSAAYVFVKPAGGWRGTVTESAKLIAAQSSSEDCYFTAVDIYGDTIVVGAYLDEVVPQQVFGSAYVFVKPAGGWAGIVNERARLIASSERTNEYPFGASVAVDGETIVVGSDFDMINEYGRGTAYVFRRPANGWSGMLTPQAKIAPSGDKRAEQALDPRERDVRSFGYTLAVAGDTIVAGSWKSAYVFVEPVEGWTGVLTEDQKLSAPAGAAATPVDILALSGDTLVVGAPSADTGRFRRQGVDADASGNPGVAYVYMRLPSGQTPNRGW